ncbi:unnamed protein product [Symbiodinium pilosum]|uniref:Integrase catalytic domain-containing protein n=1 Tax=Symbiodinium pilosum TaxID=2952 RepID=A0A812MJQ7_SYMPI|nr:unnamed protein product [Symbiodinium pilosum]
MFQWLQDSSDAHVNQDTHASQVEDHMYNLYGQRPSAKALVQEELTTEFTAAERERWLHKIRLLHGATGHGSKDVLKQALVKRGVDKRVVQLVDEFRCSVCEERKRPAPRRVATLEVHPERWKVMLADGAHWVHPGSKVRNVIGLYMDQNSRFLVGKVLVQHKTHLPNAETYIRFFQEHWQQYFGKPEILRYDAEGTWRSKALDSAFSDMGIMLDPVPGDAHWHISPLERSIAWVKECLSKLALQEPQMDTQAALASALEAWNNREVVRGFSPRQHALGQVPDPCGRLFESDVKGLPVHMMGNPEGEIAQHQKLREEAEVAFTRWQAQQRLSRAINSKERKIPEFDTAAGQVEQLRFASERETVLHEFDKPVQVPWTMTELASPLGKEEYEDITMEVPSTEEVTIHGEAPAWQAPLRRVRHRQPGIRQEATEAQPEEAPPQRHRSRFWSTETAGVAIEVEMPKTRHGWHQAVRDLPNYLASALKKKNIEVYERHMDQDTKARFRQAKMVEVRKFVASKALEALPPDKQPSRQEAMRMRWLLTWKTDHEGVPCSTVETMMEVNALLHKIKDAARDPMIIRPLGSPEEVTLVAWTDASNQNRRNGDSTAGIFIGAAHKRISEGYMCDVNPMFWSSSKIGRVCRSPGSAEARAAIDGEDVLYLLRYQWGELLGRRPNLKDPDTCVKQTPGILVTDSRNVFDRMQQPYISPTGEQKRIDLELLMLKESQRRTQLEIRWVNAQAMLANSLTKRGEDQQFNRYVSCGFRWKLVDDPEMFSGRERTRRGLDGLGLDESAELQDVSMALCSGQEAM